MTARHRLANLRPVGVAYLWAIAAALVFTGTGNLHPRFGRVWDVLAGAGAVALAGLPFVTSSRVRAGLVGCAAFVIMLHAEEWVRLSQASPVGLSIAALWIAALVGVVAQVSGDQELRIGAKLDRPLE